MTMAESVYVHERAEVHLQFLLRQMRFSPQESGEHGSGGVDTSSGWDNAADRGSSSWFEADELNVTNPENGWSSTQPLVDGPIDDGWGSGNVQPATTTENGRDDAAGISGGQFHELPSTIPGPSDRRRFANAMLRAETEAQDPPRSTAPTPEETRIRVQERSEILNGPLLTPVETRREPVYGPIQIQLERNASGRWFMPGGFPREVGSMRFTSTRDADGNVVAVTGRQTLSRPPPEPSFAEQIERDLVEVSFDEFAIYKGDILSASKDELMDWPAVAELTQLEDLKRVLEVERKVVSGGWDAQK
jgi:hypothetical protein